MCAFFGKNSLPLNSLVDKEGNVYEYSFLPQIQSAIENEKRNCQEKQLEDEQFKDWDDEIILEFIRKDSLEKYIEDPNERKMAILNNRKFVYFPVNKNLEASDEMPLYEFHSLNRVKDYEEYIEAASKKYNVDSNLIRAIVYMETTHGYYDVPISNLLRMVNLDKQAFASKAHKSILPMNINSEYWGNYLGTREQLLEPQYNIEAGTKLLGQLIRVVKGYDVEKIASLYNNLATRRINDYGKRVAKFYREKPWLYEYDPYIYQSDKDWKHFCRGLLMTIIENYPFLLH